MGNVISTNPAADVLVVGGGIVGSAVAFGMAEQGPRVIMLDEGDVAFRAARGNVGLVWYHGKGKGMPRYQEWCLESTLKWTKFAERLHEVTGIDVSYQKPGGLHFCLGEEEFESRRNLLETIRREAAPKPYDFQMLDRKTTQEMLPRMTLGESVVGASFCVHEGHVNPLFLLRALHNGFKKFGGFYHPEHPVFEIRHSGGEYVVETPKRSFSAKKLVIAAGNGTPRLAKMVGMHIPAFPEKGQVLLTERVRPCLPFPCNRIRQTGDGNFILGSSQQDAGYDVKIETEVIQSISKHAVKVFPLLAQLRIARSWAGLRVMTPDAKPIYESSESFPGAFAIALHSGVSLAAVHATNIPRWVLDEKRPEGFESFSSRRFNVQKTL